MLAFLAFASSASATTVGVPSARITYIQANEGFFRLNLSTPMINPDGWVDPDGYIVAYTQAAHQQFLSIALTAQSRGAQVDLVIDGCYSGRPKIIAMRIKE